MEIVLPKTILWQETQPVMIRGASSSLRRPGRGVCVLSNRKWTLLAAGGSHTLIPVPSWLQHFIITHITSHWRIEIRGMFCVIMRSDLYLFIYIYAAPYIYPYMGQSSVFFADRGIKIHLSGIFGGIICHAAYTACWAVGTECTDEAGARKTSRKTPVTQ